MSDRDQYTYSAEVLYRHIGCLWDSEYVLKSKDPSEIRAPADPGRTPDLPLIVADIRRAWRQAPLDSLERQVFLLTDELTATSEAAPAAAASAVRVARTAG